MGVRLFQWKFYLLAYHDLYMHLPHTQEGAIDHFLNYGAAERRTGHWWSRFVPFMTERSAESLIQVDRIVESLYDELFHHPKYRGNPRAQLLDTWVFTRRDLDEGLCTPDVVRFFRHFYREQRHTVMAYLLPSLVPRTLGGGPNEILVISAIRAGGSYRYLETLKSFLSSCGAVFRYIATNEELEDARAYVTEGQTIIVQHLLDTSLEIGRVAAFIRTNALRCVIPIHDNYWLSPLTGMNRFHQGVHDLGALDRVPPYEYWEFLRGAASVLFPSRYIYHLYETRFTEAYGSFLEPGRGIVTPPIDRAIDPPPGSVCEKEGVPGDCVVRLVAITEVSEYKGRDQIADMIRSFREWHDPCTGNPYRIEYHLFGTYWGAYDAKDPIHRVAHLYHERVFLHGSYDEENIFPLLARHRIHGLFFLNKWPETYSFALTKGFITRLPLLYTTLGALPERVRDAGVETATPVSAEMTLDQWPAILAEFCGTIRAHGFRTLDPASAMPRPLTVPSFYHQWMTDVRRTIVTWHHTNLHRWVHPFAIYFPQYHPTPENDVLFEKGYTDLVGVYRAKQSYPSTIQTPSRALFSDAYEPVRNHRLFRRQCRIASSYGFRGFALYYYWFSTNSITRNHRIFETFFEHAFGERAGIPDGFYLYFLWANEDWTANDAFGNHSHDARVAIENDYSSDSIEAMCENLISFIRHPSYHRHPVSGLLIFGIHHPWCFPSLDRFHQVLDQIRAFFLARTGSSIHLLCNGMDARFRQRSREARPGESIEWYDHHPNYKTNDQPCYQTRTPTATLLEYPDYTQWVLDQQSSQDPTMTSIPSVFTHFNNMPRLWCHPQKHRIMTCTRNVSCSVFTRFVLSQLVRVCQSPSRLFHVNAWNEWGEQMMLEPSEENGHTLLRRWMACLLACHYENWEDSVEPSKEVVDVSASMSREIVSK